MYSSQLSNEHEHESEFHALHGNEDRSTPASLADDYRFIKEIGHGSQGRIYLAKRLSDDQNVIIKQLNIDSINTSSFAPSNHAHNRLKHNCSIPHLNAVDTVV